MAKNYTRVIGSTDVYSRKIIDRNIDRLERLYSMEKDHRQKLAVVVDGLAARVRVLEAIIDTEDE